MRATRVAHDDRPAVPGAQVDDRRPPTFDRVGDDEVVRAPVRPQRLVERQRDLLERAPAELVDGLLLGAGERRVESDGSRLEDTERDGDQHVRGAVARAVGGGDRDAIVVALDGGDDGAGHDRQAVGQRGDQSLVAAGRQHVAARDHPFRAGAGGRLRREVRGGREGAGVLAPFDAQHHVHGVDGGGVGVGQEVGDHVGDRRAVTQPGDRVRGTREDGVHAAEELHAQHRIGGVPPGVDDVGHGDHLGRRSRDQLDPRRLEERPHRRRLTGVDP